MSQTVQQARQTCLERIEADAKEMERQSWHGDYPVQDVLWLVNEVHRLKNTMQSIVADIEQGNLDSLNRVLTAIKETA